MKNVYRFSFMVMLLVLLTSTEACKKYEDGPLLSLRSRTERVSNTWKVENYKVNGTDYTSLVANYTETYSKDGNYSYSWGVLSGSGTWKFQNKDAEIKLTGISNQDDHVLVILKLEEKSFWYYYLDGNDRYEFHFIQK
jgi:hypothetical protein